MNKELKILIKTDAKTGELKVYQGEMSKVIRKVAEFKDKTERSLSAMEKFANRMRVMAHVGAALYAFKQMSDVMSGFAGSIIGVASQFEKLQSVLKTLDPKNAKESFEWIKNFTKNTPYELQEVTQAFIKLKAYGIDAQKDLKTLGDTAAAMGKGLDQAVEAIADAVNGEFERLKEFGIKASSQGDKVAFRWIDASGRMRTATVQNNAKIIESTLSAIWNEKYAGAMDKLSQTFEGKLSNLKDSWSSFADKLARDSGLFARAKKAIGKLTEELNKMANNKTLIKQFGIAMTQTARLVVGSVSIITKAIVGWIELMITAKATKDALFATANTGWEQLKQRFEYYLGWLAGDEKKMAYHKKKYEELQKSWDKGMGKIHGDLQDSIGAYDKLLQQLDEFGDELVNIKDPIVEVGNASKKSGSDVVSSLKGAGKAASTTSEKMKDYVGAYVEYLESVGKKTEAFWLKEGKKLQRLYENGIGGDKLIEVMNADYAKFIKSIQQKSKKGSDSLKQHTKKTVEYVETTFDKATKNIYKSFDDNFFDLITGKFHDFKSFLRSLFDDILHGIVNPFARALSGAIAGGLGSFVGLPKISVASIASQLGLKDAGDKFVGMVNGTEVSISKSGEILSGGNALPSDAVNLLSTVKSGYTIATGSAAGGLYSIGNSLYTAGYTNSGMAFIGAGNWISGAGTSGLTTAGQIGYYGGGALIGAGMGYGIGTLGDMLFGADTKAALYGSILGAIGSIAGPLGAFIGSVVGSVTGGLFGKWKTQEVGKQINTLLTEGSIDSSAITDYAYNKKKNWFHTKKRWKDLGIDQEDLFAIRKLFAAYNETLKRFGSELEITLEKGRLKIDKNSNEFDEYISKEFIKNLMGLDKSISKLKPIFEGHYKEFGGETLYLVERFAKSRMKWIDNAIAKAATQAEKDELIKAKEDLGRVKEVYEAWKAYAKKQEKSVSEAIVEAFKGLESLDDTFKKINYEFAGLNGGAIIQTQNAITILKTGLSDLSDFLGKDIPYRVGMSVEEFKQLEEAVLKASPTPEAIGALERFGGAIAEVARAANSVKLDYYKTYKPDVYDEKAKKLLVSSFTESMKQTVGEETWKKMQKAGITFETPEDIVKFVETTVGNDEKGIKKYTVYKDGKKTTIDENTLLAVTAPYYYEAKKMSGKPLPQQPHATKDEPKKSYAPTPVEARYSTYSIASEIDKYLYTRGRSGIDALKAQVEWAKRYKKELFAALHVGGWTLETLNEYLKKHKDLSAKDLEKVRKIKEALVELDSAERMYNEALEQRKAQIAQQWQSLLDAVQASKIRKKVDELNKAIESLSDKLSSLKGASSTLDNLIDRFTSKLESPAEREAKFYSFLDLAKSALAAQNYADYNAYLQKASKYADFVEGKQYSSSAEKRWEIARIANELKDLKSPTDLMIERLDRMIEQNRQIIDATQGSKDSLYELVNVKIGGKTFEEITKDGLIQGIKSPDFTAIVGDNLDAISSELTGAGAYFQNIRLQDGKTLSLVDFDQDGRTDLTLAFDASGKLTGIQQNTKALLDLQVQELTRATKQLYAINAAPDYLKNYVATQYSADYDYVKTQQGQLEYNFITPLEQTAVSLLKHLNSGQLNADLAATIRGEAYQIQSLAKILSDNGLGGKSVWLDAQHHYVSDLLDYYSYIDQLLKNRGFATGGYTGDYPTDAPVGVVHGQEFVLNAETTRNLGLNKDGGGVFVELLVEVKKLRGEVERLRSENAQLQAQIARNTEPIATAQRWDR